MTNERMRIVIAESLGWKLKNLIGLISKQPTHYYAWFIHTDLNGDMPICICSTHRTKEDAARCLPNYPASLDACAEAIATLSEGEMETFLGHLKEIMGTNHFTKLIRFKASDGCLAFIRTKGITLD
jgi:hypothetical protein